MQQSEIDALKKAVLYSLQPNKLGYCGPPDSWRAFNKFLSNPSQQNAFSAKELLRRFNALYPYLHLIASANSLQAFDEQVIEAYWLGNQLLENVSFREMQKIILSFQKHGLPSSIAEKKAANLPEEMLPHHSMHVLHINFLSQKVKPFIQNLSNCLIQWGTVQGQTTKGIKVKGVELLLESNELKLKEKEKTIQNPFNLQLQPNDQISVHWGNAIEKISGDELKNLKNHNIKNLQALSQ